MITACRITSRWLWVTFKVIHLLPAFLNGIFVQLCSSWQDFISHSASRGPSAISEFLVGMLTPKCRCLESAAMGECSCYPLSPSLCQLLSYVMPLLSFRRIISCSIGRIYNDSHLFASMFRKLNGSRLTSGCGLGLLRAHRAHAADCYSVGAGLTRQKHWSLW